MMACTAATDPPTVPAASPEPYDPFDPDAPAVPEPTDPPPPCDVEALDQSQSVPLDETLALVLEADLCDLDEPAVYEFLEAPTRGLLVGEGAVYTYLPREVGDDSLQWRVTVEGAGSSTATVEVTVTP